MGEKPLTIEDLIRADDGPKDWRQFPRLMRASFALVLRAARREFVLTTVLQIFSGAAMAGQLLIGRELLTALFAEGATLASLAPWVAAVLGLATLMRFAAFAEQEQSTILRELVQQHAQARIIDVTARLALEEFESAEFFNRLRRATMGSGMRTMQLVQGIVVLARSSAAAIGSLIVLILLQPLLLPMLALTALPLWLVTKRNSRASFRFFVGATPLDRARDYIVGLFTERDSAKEVRAFTLAPYLRARYEELGERRIEELRKTTRTMMKRSMAGSAVSAVLAVATFGALAWMFLSGRLDLASAGIAAAALLQLTATVGSLGMGVAQLYGAALFVRDYDDFLKLGEGHQVRDDGRSLPPFKEVKVEGVTFAYPGSAVPALKGVDLTLRAGEVVALVGENGSGKTTLAKLLAHLYRPTDGKITWDGADTAQSPQHEQITLIFQDFMQYQLTARENIGLSRADDLDAVRQAAREADADTFLSGLEDGYETILGKEFLGGTDLSIGQWQRVALARAFFRQAPFIVLDEPTAALDARAEHELFQRIRELFRGRTVLLISHRFSTVRSADHIYVLHQGEIVEHGDHDDLMTQQGRYAELFTLQAASYT
ncbi:ABC transporter ATP-binding protein [Nonomuraea sp. NPDC050663]|uniref:ABC transporter ATP-binding protein n=1 Tax=Nonomuraea sp. NPDC050663 TaxID=3364370 RepID=UPI00379F7369